MHFLSKRETKKLKRMIPAEGRPDFNEGKELKKTRKFSKSYLEIKVREKNWLSRFEKDEEDPVLEIFEKNRKGGNNTNKKALHPQERKVFSMGNHGLREEKQIAANADQIIIITSLFNPPLKKGLIDRFLVAAEKNRISAIICLNKIDLCIDGSYRKEMTEYTSIGYKVIFTSARLNIGIDELRECIKNKRSIVSGHSGVGKSSLINAVDSSLDLKTGEISSHTDKGKHTTTSIRLFKLACGGEIFDCPGIKLLGFPDLKSDEVSQYFREFGKHRSLCEFPDCIHIKEEHCGVKTALERGDISKTRYESYIRIWNSLNK